ncbi:MAG: dihydroorotase [Dehalococcoidales bacterium]|nr:dihydroorotase [Dehalococcoidales bacterium]
MTKGLLIRGGRIIDPSQKIDGTGSLLIREGKIVWQAQGEFFPPGWENYNVLLVNGLVVCPGFIDFHCHLREPGFVAKETIATGIQAASKGGFTTICCMPNTDPPMDSEETIKYVKSKADKEKGVVVLPIGCVTVGRKGKTLVDMKALAKAGVAGFSDDGEPVKTAALMKEALVQSRELGLPVIDHCEEPVGGAPEGEERIVARDIKLAEKTGGWVHIAHVSTAGAVQSIRKAKAKGIKVTAEVTPHHLTLTKDAVKKYGTLAKVNPPLRTKRDVQALIQGLKEGVIDIIATDHAPHTAADKQGDFASAAAGISGFETALSSLMGLVHSGALTMNEVIACLTIKPAQILGKQLGSLAVGMTADITVFDPDKEWTVNVKKFASKGKNTPLAGSVQRGKVLVTISAGEHFVWGG